MVAGGEPRHPAAAPAPVDDEERAVLVDREVDGSAQAAGPDRVGRSERVVRGDLAVGVEAQDHPPRVVAESRGEGIGPAVDRDADVDEAPALEGHESGTDEVGVHGEPHRNAAEGRGRQEGLHAAPFGVERTDASGPRLDDRDPAVGQDGQRGRPVERVGGDRDRHVGTSRRGWPVLAASDGEQERGEQSRASVPAWVPDDLPAAPGVYQFESVGGIVLYVGKSVNLRRRVRGWFHGGGPDSPRLAEMIALARAVRVERTGSDLEARLVESERIVAGRPRYNRALKNRARGWYLELDYADPFPRPRVVRAPRRPRARYFGPWSGRAVPERIARLLERVFRLRSCPGHVQPDRDGSPCLAHGLDLCAAPCIHAIRLDAYRAAVAALEPRWLGGAWLIALPHARPTRGVLVALVRGRVLPRREVAWEDAGWREAVEDACYAARMAALTAEPVRAPGEVVASRIVTGWLMDGAPGGLPVDLDRHDDAEVAAVLRAWGRAS